MMLSLMALPHKWLLGLGYGAHIGLAKYVDGKLKVSGKISVYVQPLIKSVRDLVLMSMRSVAHP
jgi:hypothetical protein